MVRMVGFVGGTGGASVLMRGLSAALAARGIETAMAVPTHDGTSEFVRQVRADGTRADRTALLNQGGRSWRILSDALQFVGAVRAPITHYHLTQNCLHHQFMRAMEMLRVPRAFVTVHDPYGADLRPGSALARRWAEFVRDRVEKVICVSQGVLERQLGYGVPRERLTLIHNGVDVDRFSAGDARVAFGQLGLPLGTPLVLFCSRLAQQKRPLDAVRAFAALTRRVPDAHMAVVGDGPMTGAVIAEVERLGLRGRVHMVGYRFDVEHWLAAASVWFLPTEAEAFSVAVLEAMAAGRAIVTTACAGNEEVLTDGANAALTPVGDVSGMAAALERLLGDESARRRLGDAARRDATRYSFERMVTRHVECYESVLAARETRRVLASRLAFARRHALAQSLAVALTLIGPFLP